jgi:hypothetical protein
VKRTIKNISAVVGSLGIGIALFFLFLPYGVYLEYQVKFNPMQAWAFVSSKAPIVYAINASETDQGVVGNGRTMKAFIDAIGGTRKATLKILHTSKSTFTNYTLTTSEVITDNIALDPDHGARLDGAGTLTINGPFEHGLSQCFGSSITVIFSWDSCFTTIIYSEWWGAKGDNSTASASAINKAIQSLPSANIIPKMAFCPGGLYQIGTDNNAIHFDRPVFLEGNNALLKYGSAGTGTAVLIEGSSSVINNLRVYHEGYTSIDDVANLSGVGIKALNMKKWRFYNPYVEGFGWGMSFSGEGAGISYGEVYSPRMNWNRIGFYFDSTDLDASYCTDIKTYGGAFDPPLLPSKMTGSRNVVVEETNTHHTVNGICFFGTNLEGGRANPADSVEYKVVEKGENNLYSGVYWDYTNGGTDIYLTSGSKNILIVGGANLRGQAITDSGARNAWIDPDLGIKFYGLFVDSDDALVTQTGYGGIGKMTKYVYSNDSLPDDEAFSLPTGEGILTITVNDEYGMFHIKTDGTPIKMSGSANIIVGTTDGKVGVYDTDTNANIINRLGVNAKVRAIFEYN